MTSVFLIELGSDSGTGSSISGKLSSKGLSVSKSASSSLPRGSPVGVSPYQLADVVSATNSAREGTSILLFDRLGADSLAVFRFFFCMADFGLGELARYKHTATSCAR